MECIIVTCNNCGASWDNDRNHCTCICPPELEDWDIKVTDD